jgi:NAD(P)-dependent dehydrogenase (short-subunit alcohol dehydrogenase family)
MTSVLITGANKGLGKETAARLAELGWTVWLGARQPELGQAAAQELAAGGRDVRYLPIDVTSDESVAAAVELVPALDVLINNAGVVGPHTPPAEIVAADFLSCVGVNLLGPVRVTHAFLPRLRQSEHPRIVMVSSGLGSLTAVADPERVEYTVNSLVYPSSKAALNMITVQYAKALPGMKVNAVDPGYTATDLNGHSGYKTVAEGARAIVNLATIGPDGPTGGFFDEAGVAAW